MNNFKLTTVRTIVCAGLLALVGIAHPADLRVMPTGLGIGTITGTGINCGNGAVDCTEALPDSAMVTLTAAEVAGTGSIFAGWDGACSGTALTCTLAMSTVRSVRARFDLTSGIAPLTGFMPADITAYLANPTNAHVNTPARFISALPVEFRDNWILMPRSESLQTGTAVSPRILFVSADAQRVFTVGMTTSSSYPGAHPNAVEYMQWDATQKNFRFHEIVLAPIPALGDVIDPGPPPVLRFEARSRQVTVDDPKCFACPCGQKTHPLLIYQHFNV